MTVLTSSRLGLLEQIVIEMLEMEVVSTGLILTHIGC